MRFLSFVTFFFMISGISAQALKKITIDNEFTRTREEISVLAADKETREGAYKLFEYDKLKIEGNYLGGLKEGNWKEFNYSGKTVVAEYNYHSDTLHGSYIEYFSNGNLKQSLTYQNGLKNGPFLLYENKKDIFEQGNYENDQPTGIWEFNTNGKLIHKYDFDTNKFLVNNDTAGNKNVIIYDDLKNPMDTVDVMPYLLGGIQHFYYFLGQEIEYPRMARDNGIEGTVYVELIIDELGNIESAKIKRGIGGGCDEESIRVLLLTSGKWIPAYDEGKPVKMKITQPIKYSISE